MKYSDIALIISGGTPKTTNPEYWNGDIPWLSVVDFSGDDKFVYTTEKTISQQGLKNSSTKLLQKNDMIISARGTVGALAVLAKPMAFNQSCFGIRAKEGVDAEFLYYLTIIKIKELKTKSKIGNIFKSISLDTFDMLNVSLPTYEEQINRSKILATIDRKIALNRRMNTTLEAMAKQLYDYWFVQFDFPNAEGKPYKSSAGKMVWNEKLKREIPEGWEVKALNDTTKNEMDSINPYDNPDAIYKHFSIPSYDLCESYTKEKGSDILSNKFILTSKDIIVSKLNPWTSRVIWGQDLENAICSTEFVSLAPNDIKEKGFIYFLAKSQPFIAYCTKASTGTSHSHRRVNPDLLRMYSFPYEKETIIKYSEIVGNYAEKMISNLEEISKLITLRDYLLPLLMNGQVTIKE